MNVPDAVETATGSSPGATPGAPDEYCWRPGEPNPPPANERAPLARSAGTLSKGDSSRPRKDATFFAYGAEGSDDEETDMREVIPEAFELVDQGLMTSADFRDFARDNVLKLHAGMNPEFFAGTRVETYAKDFLGALRDDA
jgi:hypothetical protein